MKDNHKSKSQLIDELVERRRRIAELEQREVLVTKSSDNHRLSQGHYRLLLEDDGDAIFITDLQGNFLKANRRAEKLVGYTGKELKRMDIRDIHPKENQRRIINDFSRIAGGEIMPFYDTKVLRKDGTMTPVDITACPIEYQGRRLIRGIFRDITERKQAEESERELSTLLDNIPDAIARFDTNCSILFANPAAVKWLACPSSDELIGKRVSEIGQALNDPFSRDVESTIKRALEKGIVSSIETEWTLAAGRRFLHVFNIPERGENGEVVSVLSIVYDFTDRKRTEEELLREVETRREAEKALQAEQTALQDTNTALRVLLKHREEDKKDLEERLISNVRQLVLPYVEKLRKSKLSPEHQAIIGFIQANLNEIVSPFLNNLRHFNLTPRQTEIAAFIKAGRTTKDIAELLHIGRDAVEKHRRAIRKKLHLNNEKKNLRSYLLSLGQ